MNIIDSSPNSVPLEVAVSPVAGFNVIDAVIASLQEKFKASPHDVKTPKGLAAEKKDRAELKGYRLQVEEKRVELKAPYLNAEREIDAHAKKLTEAISELEKARDKRIKDEEQRKRDEKLAEEREAQAKRDAAIEAERQAAAEREKELKAQLAAVQAQLEAAKPAPVIEDFPIAASFGGRVESENPAPAGWERIESGSEQETLVIPARGRMVSVPQHVGIPAAHDDELLDLLSASEAHSKHTQRPATGLELPTANEIADALSVAAKRRTTIRNVTDVLEAIRALRDGN